MKKILYYAILVIAFSTALLSCTKDSLNDTSTKCSPSDTQVHVGSVNIFDGTFGSPYQGQVIANFKFNQTTITCPELNSATNLSVQNNTSNTVTLDYNINFQLNFAHWNYQGIITIPPHAFIDAGIINDNPARIDLGVMTIQCASIRYQ